MGRDLRPRFEASPGHSYQILITHSYSNLLVLDSRFNSVILRLRQANHTRRFYALSPSEVCYLAPSSATRGLRADREPSSRKIPWDENRLSKITAAFMPRPTSP